MSIQDTYSVQAIKKYESKEWLLEKHYAKRMPSISYAFGLYRGGALVGVMTIGKPASPSLCVGICGPTYAEYVFELNRLCVSENLERNALSYFVGRSLRLINDSLILVSYADTAQGHHGYIYQATNWIYTGATVARTDIATDVGTHSRHYEKATEYPNRTDRSSKHRYVQFLGKLGKVFRVNLRYKIQPYPKGENQRYDASFEPVTQAVLF